MAGWPGHEGEGEGGMRRKEDLPFSYVGRKQINNTPLDMGPYERIEWSKTSFPGGRPLLHPEQHVPYASARVAKMMVLMPRSWRSWPQSAQLLPPTKHMTIFFSTIASEKLPLLVCPSDTVKSLRQKIWEKTHRSIKLQELDDDIEARCANAAWGGRPTKLSEVEDVASDKSLPGNPHYSRLDMVEPGAAPTPCTLRKKAPCPPGYTPPLRTAQQGGELELFVGLVRLQDGMPPPLAQTVNTGVVPKWRDQTLTEAGVRAGCVVRVEYTRTSGEISLSLGLKAREERGGVNDAETVVGRVFDTVLDPDWYVSAIESAPNLVLDFFAVDYPGVDQSAKCTSNCEVKNRPHVGWLEPMNDRPSATTTYQTTYVQQVVRSQPPAFGSGAPATRATAVGYAQLPPRERSEGAGHTETVTLHAGYREDIGVGTGPPRPMLVEEARTRMNTQMV